MAAAQEHQREVPDVYVPHNILITGGAGFIASHVAIHLCTKYPQYKIHVFDKLDYCASLENLRSIRDRPNFNFIHGNILSADLVNYCFQKENIDTVLHFAAQTHVDNSFGNSFTFTENNVLGTHVLLEAAKANNIKRFIHVSTDEVYGGEADEHSAENAPLEPSNPYAASKAGAEYIVKAYHRSFKLPTIITRGNNVYGTHQYPEKVIPKFVCRLARGKPCCIHGDGSNKRNFLHVRDVARAFDLILHKGIIGEIYNVGNHFEISNKELARSIIRMMGLTGQEDKLIEFVEDRPFNDFRYPINSRKLEALGWREAENFEDGLRETVKWYLDPDNFYWPGAETALVAHPRRPQATLRRRRWRGGNEE